MLTNEDIKKVENILSEKAQKIQDGRMILNKCSTRLDQIKLLPRKVEIPATEAREVLVDDPTRPKGPKIKTTIPGNHARTDEVFDIIPKSPLSDIELTEEIRTQVLDSVKKDLTAL